MLSSAGRLNHPPGCHYPARARVHCCQRDSRRTDPQPGRSVASRRGLDRVARDWEHTIPRCIRRSGQASRVPQFRDGQVVPSGRGKQLLVPMRCAQWRRTCGSGGTATLGPGRVATGRVVWLCGVVCERVRGSRVTKNSSWHWWGGIQHSRRTGPQSGRRRKPSRPGLRGPRVGNRLAHHQI